MIVGSVNDSPVLQVINELVTVVKYNHMISNPIALILILLYLFYYIYFITSILLYLFYYIYDIISILLSHFIITILLYLFDRTKYCMKLIIMALIHIIVTYRRTTVERKKSERTCTAPYAACFVDRSTRL